MALSNNDDQSKPNDFSQFLRSLVDEFPDFEQLLTYSNYANSFTGQTDPGACVQKLRYLYFNDLSGREQYIREFRHLKGHQTFQSFSILVGHQYSASRSRASNEQSKISFSSRTTSSTSLALKSFGASISFNSIFSKEATVDSTQTSFTDPLEDAPSTSYNKRDNQIHTYAVARYP